MITIAPDGAAIKWPRLYQNRPGSKLVKKLGRTWWVADEAHKCQACAHGGWCLVRFDEVICMRHDRTNWAGEGTTVDFTDGEQGFWHALRPEVRLEGCWRDKGSTEWNPAGLDANDVDSDTETVDVPVVEQTDQLPDQELDRIYRGILECLTLKASDHADLKARGLSDEAIVRKGYKTARPLTSNQLSALQQNLGLTSLNGVPGLYVRAWFNNVPYWANLYTHGIYIPQRNAAGQIVALQMRSNDGIYRHFSSPPDTRNRSGTLKYTDGTKLRRIANVAVPPGSSLRDELWITEAGLKADVASELLKRPFIGVPGAGAWKLALECRDLLNAPRAIVVAYDADKRSNGNVARGEALLVAELQRLGHRVRIANWDTDDKGNPNGIDDLAAMGRLPRLEAPKGQASPTGAASTTDDKKKPRLQTCPVPPWVHVRRDTHSVLYANAHVMGHIEGAIKNATQRPRVGAMHIRSDPCGVGKTTAVATLLRERPDLRVISAVNGPAELKVAVLTDSSRETESAEEVKKAKFLAKKIGQKAVYLSGRTAENCERIDEVMAVGKAQHSVARAICQMCKWGPNGAKTGRSRKIKGAVHAGSTCSYFKHHEKAGDVPIHVLHKNSLLSSSRRVSDYDVIVVDEELPDLLMKQVTLNNFDLVTWQQSLSDLHAKAMNDYQRALDVSKQVAEASSGPFSKVTEEKHEYCRAIEAHLNIATALANCTARLQRVPGAHLVEHRALVPVLAEETRMLGSELRDLIALALGKKTYCELENVPHFPHENPVVHPRTERIPIRAWRDLLQIVNDELQRPTGDSQAYIVSVSETPEGGIKAAIELRIPRHDLIESLRKRTVINLDATPNRALLDRLFTNIEAAGIQVPEDVHVTQFTDFINGASASAATKAKRLTKILERALAKSKGRIGVLAHKATLQHLGWIGENGKDTSPDPRVVTGYWGRDHRASNRYEGCEVLIISGYFIPPIDTVERDVQAWRRHFKISQPARATATHLDRAYGYCDEKGMGRSFRCRLHPDPEVDARLSWIWSTNVQQAIGRLRAARAGAPRFVYLDSAMPANEVLIATLGPLETAIKQQPAPLRAKTEALKRESQDRIRRLVDEFRPIYDQMRRDGSGVISRLRFACAVRDSGKDLSDWDARQVLAALDATAASKQAGEVGDSI